MPWQASWKFSWPTDSLFAARRLNGQDREELHMFVCVEASGREQQEQPKNTSGSLLSQLLMSLSRCRDTLALAPRCSSVQRGLVAARDVFRKDIQSSFCQ